MPRKQAAPKKMDAIELQTVIKGAVQPWSWEKTIKQCVTDWDDANDTFCEATVEWNDACDTMIQQLNTAPDGYDFKKEVARIEASKVADRKEDDYNHHDWE